MDFTINSYFHKYLVLFKKDLHGSWEKFTGHHSALFPRSDETDATQRTLNVDFAVHYWIEKGFNKSKINLGLATYGRSFELKNPSQNSLGSGVVGAGSAGAVNYNLTFSFYIINKKVHSSQFF